MKFKALLIAILLAIQVSAETSNGQVAEELRSSLERSAPEFSVQTRRHFATRMYRISGDSSYIALIAPGAYEFAELLKRDATNIQDEAYSRERVRKLLTLFNQKTRKGRMRYEYFEKNNRLLLMTELLAECKQTREYGLSGSEQYRAADSTAMRLIRDFDFSKELLNVELIRIYSAQVANRIYDLHFLGVVDLRKRFFDVFNNCFPDSMDDALSHAEFEDKLYGLTHIVIAASEYYQSTVSDSQSLSAIDYLSENFEAILAEARHDIVAEVGLCFLLADSDHRENIERCRAHLIEAIPKKSYMIPAIDGDNDAEEGEHRNVLTLMLLMWNGNLHRGPSLLEISTDPSLK